MINHHQSGYKIALLLALAAETMFVAKDIDGYLGNVRNGPSQELLFAASLMPSVVLIITLFSLSKRRPVIWSVYGVFSILRIILIVISHAHTKTSALIMAGATLSMMSISAVSIIAYRRQNNIHKPI